MTDFWAIKAQQAFASAAPSTSAASLASAQNAAAEAGHAFYHGRGEFAPLEDLIDEVRELEEALRENHGKLHIRNELGDVMMSLVNICRLQGLDFEATLHRSGQRWLARKALQESKIQALGYTWKTIPREVNDQVWKDVKSELKASEYQE